MIKENNVSAILTKELRMDAQRAFYDSLRNGYTPTYFVFGKSSNWNELDTVDATLTDNTELELTKSHDLIAGKRLSPNDITPCAKRVDWISGEVYNRYTMYSNMNYIEKHYVLTDEFNVYKCLSNASGKPSTVKPTGTSLTPLETSDGYKWKYLYTISNRDAQVFLTSKLMPVSFYPPVNSSQYNVQAAAIPGTIDSFTITEEGSGYTIGSIEILGDGTDAKAVPVISNGKIVEIKVTNPGKNYTYAKCIIKGNGTTTAQVVPEISPLYGHGSNIPKEICASYIMLACVFGKTDENKQLWSTIPEEFNFRKIGIVNTLERNNSQNIVDELVNFCHVITVESLPSDIQSGDTITLNNNDKATVVSLSDNKIFLNELGSVATDEWSSFTTSTGTTGIITAVEYKPDFNKHRMKLLYLETLPRTTRNKDNTADLIRFAIEF